MALTVLVIIAKIFLTLLSILSLSFSQYHLKENEKMSYDFLTFLSALFNFIIVLALHVWCAIVLWML